VCCRFHTGAAAEEEEAITAFHSGGAAGTGAAAAAGNGEVKVGELCATITQGMGAGAAPALYMVQAELQRRGVGAPVSAKHALLFFVLATFLL
jgi:hypothetical protein